MRASASAVESSPPAGVPAAPSSAACSPVFVWHSHQETDEAFIVIDGILEIEFRDGSIKLNPGELFVVPKGVEHRPVAQSECKILLLEPKNVINTGETVGEMTAENDVWI